MQETSSPNIEAAWDFICLKGVNHQPFNHETSVVHFPFSVGKTPALMLKSRYLWHSHLNSKLYVLMVHPQKALCFIVLHQKVFGAGNTGLMDSIKEYLSPSTTLFRLSTTTTGAGREELEQLEDLDLSSKTMEKHNQEILHGTAVDTNRVNDKSMLESIEFWGFVFLYKPS